MLKIEGRRFIDRSKIQTLTRKAISYYKGQGFYDAELDYSTVPIDNNEVDITFTVKEGERYHVNAVTLQGVADLDQSEMLSQLQIKRYKWWNSWLFGTGRVNDEMMESDKQILRQYLLDNGYIEGCWGGLD